jgi:hypothetical protein
MVSKTPDDSPVDPINPPTPIMENLLNVGLFSCCQLKDADQRNAQEFHTKFTIQRQDLPALHGLTGS